MYRIEEIDGKCLECGGELSLERTCTRVYLLCRACGKEYPKERYKELMDDYMEELLANVPVDRL